MLPLNPTVFVVDPDASVRASLEAVIRPAGWTPETFASAAAFLARRAPMGPSCLVVEITLPELDGFDLLRRIAADRKETPIIAVADHGDIPMTVRVMRAGAVEFLMKPLADDVLLTAVGHALARSRATLDREAESLELRRRYDSLSGREREVMARVVAGHPNKRIGAALGISEITVKAHRGQAMRKMRAESLAELVMMAMRLRLPPVPTTQTLPVASPSNGYAMTGAPGRQSQLVHSHTDLHAERCRSRSPGRAEALGTDARWIMTELHEHRRH
jgi:FixJ family two-component response regulator